MLLAISSSAILNMEVCHATLGCVNRPADESASAFRE